jgi:ATP-dependent Lon protease
MKLDKRIHGLEDVKQEIMEYVARKITNPNGKGHVLALYGSAGTGKSKIIQTLAEALDLPFHQINFGGLNDAAILTGHSETYVGSKPGKIVEALTNSKYMNPIIYLDEIDKVSTTKATDIFGVLTHLLDEEQNDKFQDNYLSNVNIDLSKVFFVLAFNDISKVDAIVSDRLKVIYINPPTLQDKITICEHKMIPDIVKMINFKKDIYLSKELIEYIITTKTQGEDGVRQLRKNIEKIFNRLNFDLLVNNTSDLKMEENVIVITSTYINSILKQKEKPRYLDMYS